MAFIETTPPESASGALAEAYGRVAGTRGKVSNVLMAHSLDPPVLEAHLDLYLRVMFSRGGLSRREREVIAVAVSRANRCSYCVAHHRAALAANGGEAAAAAFAEGTLPEDATARERALVAFARELTEDPRADRPAVDALRAEGLDDREVLQAVQVAAYFNFVNRTVLALGVSLEGDDGEGGYRY